MNKFTKLIALVALVAALIGSAVAVAATAEIRERIKPSGNVNVGGEGRQTEVAAADRAGNEVYAAACQACHATGAAGAPRTGNAGTWGDRLDQDVEDIYAHAIDGIGAMPPKGGCRNCSDAEVKAAVDFMLQETL